MSIFAKAWAWIRGRKPAPEPLPTYHYRISIVPKLDLGLAGHVYWAQRDALADAKLILAGRQFAAAVLDALENG